MINKTLRHAKYNLRAPKIRIYLFKLYDNYTNHGTSIKRKKNNKF